MKNRRIRLVSSQCYACGNESEEVEEFPKYGSVGFLITCCRECAKLGGSAFEDSIVERASYIQNRLRKKYGNLLNSPSWSDEEIQEMSGVFPAEIRRFIAHSAIARERASWNYDRHLKQLDLENDPHELSVTLGIDLDDPPFWWRTLFPGY